MDSFSNEKVYNKVVEPSKIMQGKEAPPIEFRNGLIDVLILAQQGKFAKVSLTKTEHDSSDTSLSAHSSSGLEAACKPVSPLLSTLQLTQFVHLYSPPFLVATTGYIRGFVFASCIAPVEPVEAQLSSKLCKSDSSIEEGPLLLSSPRTQILHFLASDTIFYASYCHRNILKVCGITVGSLKFLAYGFLAGSQVHPKSLGRKRFNCGRHSVPCFKPSSCSQ